MVRYKSAALALGCVLLLAGCQDSSVVDTNVTVYTTEMITTTEAVITETTTEETSDEDETTAVTEITEDNTTSDTETSETETSYVDVTDSSETTETESSYPDETDSSETTETESSYPDETETSEIEIIIIGPPAHIDPNEGMDEGEGITTDMKEVVLETGRVERSPFSKVNNKTLSNADAYVYDVFDLAYDAEQIKAMIESYEFPYSATIDGQPVPEDTVSAVLENRNLAGFEEISDIAPRYALLLSEADVRSFPTNLAPMQMIGDTEYDYIQESTLLAGEAVAVYWTSSDGKYYFVVGHDYYGWIAKNSVEFCDKEIARAYTDTKNFVFVSKKHVSIKDARPASLGTAFPTVKIYGERNIILPTYKERATGYVYIRDGELIFTIHQPNAEFLPVRTMKANEEDFHFGYYEFTDDNVKWLSVLLDSTPYSWGGKGKGYDCTSAVRAIYRCFGITMPRNTGRIPYVGAEVIDVSKMSDEEKAELINESPAGLVLVSKGHVTVSLGDELMFHCVTQYINVDGRVIHDNKCTITSIYIDAMDENTFLSGVYVMVKF